MRHPNEHIEAYRQSASELENHIIDEFKAGRLSRRELMMRGTIVGMSIPMLGLIADGAMAAPTRVAAAKAGGNLRVAVSKSATSFEPPELAGAGRDHHGPHSRRAALLRRLQVEADPHPGRELVAVERRQDLDVQAPRGRQVPRWHPDDGR